VKGINVDPANPAGNPDPAHLARLGARWVRLVSKPGIESYVEAAEQAGVLVLAVVARESAGYLVPGATVYQIGNEPDLTSHSSWTMTPAAYIHEWTTYRNTYPDFTMIAAGLASGQVAWWQEVAPHLEGCAACAVHPYAQTVASGAQLLRAYRAVRPELGLWATEWWQPSARLIPFARMLQAETDAAIWFCWSSGMVDGFGLVDAQGKPTPALGLWVVSAG
jgi:hypothetical protein